MKLHDVGGSVLEPTVTGWVWKLESVRQGPETCVTARSPIAQRLYAAQETKARRAKDTGLIGTGMVVMTPHTSQLEDSRTIMLVACQDTVRRQS